MKKLLVILLALLFLTACTPKTPTPSPEPTPPVTEVTPTPDPEPIPRSYAWDDSPTFRQWDNVRVSMVIPVFSGENQAALDIINNYFTLLSGKVLDYAEGDLTPAPGESIVVNAEYHVYLATERTISAAWSVRTTEETKNSSTGGESHFVFDRATGNLCTFADVFGENGAAVKALAVEKAKEYICANPSAYYYPQAEAMTETAFDPDNFFFSEAGVTFSFPADALGVSVYARIPYEELDGLLLMEP